MDGLLLRDNNENEAELEEGRDTINSLPYGTSNENRGAKVVINISGQRYETYEKTLEEFPNTLLGDKERRKDFYDPVNNELFFDRNRICFESILAYYQTSGILIRPPNIPRKVFISDMSASLISEQKALLQAGDGLEQPTVEQTQTTSTEKQTTEDKSGSCLNIQTRQISREESQFGRCVP